MLSESLIVFLGIALSILLIFVVVNHKISNKPIDETSVDTGCDKNRNVNSAPVSEYGDLYSRILEEMRLKMDRALRRSKEILTRKSINKRAQSIEEATVLCRNYHLTCKKVDPEYEKKEKQLAEVRDSYDKYKSAMDRMEKMRAKFYEGSRRNTIPAALSQAPLYTALFCLILVVMHTFYKLKFGNDFNTDEADIVMVSFCVYSLFYWTCIWLFRLFHNEYILRDPKNVERRFLKKYQSVMSDITLVSTIFVLIALMVLWIFAVWGLFDLGLGSYPILFYAATGLLLVLMGGAMYYARTPQDWIPYLNLYGQIVIIMLFSILVRVCMVIGELLSHPISPLSIPTKFLDWSVYFFVILNGFTFPILMPLLYHHSRATIARWNVIISAQLLNKQLKKVGPIIEFFKSKGN